MLTWQEQEVLSVFGSRNVRPGHAVLVKNLLHQWGSKGPRKEFIDAIRSLETQGFLQASAGETEYALTDAGYALIPK
jgi:hypothetical protein